MRRTGKILLIVMLVVLLAAGGVFAYARYNAARPVKAVRAGEWMLGYLPASSSLYGIAASGEVTEVVLEKGQRLAEVYVKKGDSVKKGDRLLSYDLSRASLSIEEKELEKTKLLGEVEDLRKQYKKYAKEDYVLTIATPTPSPTPTPRGYKPKQLSFSGGGTITRLAAKPTETPSPVTREYIYYDGNMIERGLFDALLADAAKWGTRHALITIADTGIKATVTADREGRLSLSVTGGSAKPDADLKNKERGTGAWQDPDQFAFSDGTVSFSRMDKWRREAAKNEYGYNVALRNEAMTAYLYFTKDGSLQMSLTKKVLPPPPYDTPEPSPTPYHGGGLSRSEREEMAAELRLQLQEKEVAYRQLELDVAALKKAAETPVLYSKTDGVVTECAEGAVEEGCTVLVIQSGSGVYVSCLIAELDLDKYKPGDTLKGFSYESGMSYAFRVKEISEMPTYESYDNGYGANSSAYVMKLEPEGAKAPAVGEFIDFSTEQTAVSEGAVFLFDAFIASEGGRDSVFKAENGLVKQIFVTTGRRVDRYVELFGLPLEKNDYIVFPGERNCRDGARADTGRQEEE